MIGRLSIQLVGFIGGALIGSGSVQVFRDQPLGWSFLIIGAALFGGSQLGLWGVRRRDARRRGEGRS